MRGARWSREAARNQRRKEVDKGLMQALPQVRSPAAGDAGLGRSTGSGQQHMAGAALSSSPVPGRCSVGPPGRFDRRPGGRQLRRLLCVRGGSGGGAPAGLSVLPARRRGRDGKGREEEREGAGRAALPSPPQGKPGFPGGERRRELRGPFPDPPNGFAQIRGATGSSAVSEPRSP